MVILVYRILGGFMLYRIGSMARTILSLRNCIIYLLLLLIGNMALAAYAPSIGGHYGVVMNTTPREFDEVDKNHPHIVKSSCTIQVQYEDQYGSRLEPVIDQGCVYKPGDRIERYLKTRNTIYRTLLVLITGFVLIAIPALLTPKHPSIIPQPRETISNEK